MRPIRNTDSIRPPQATPMSDARSSQPSVIPGPRPSMPSTAIGSIMPGSSVYVHSAVLSAVAGYVDAAGFASLVGLFPAHLTGEIVGDAIALSSGHASTHLTRLWILPVFVASVAIAAVVARQRRRRGQRALTGLLALVTGALMLFSVSDFLARLLHESWHLQLLLGGGCAVAAMGFQNALMRESLSGSCPTTVMTGNLTHVVIEIVDRSLSRLTRPHHRDRRYRSRLGPVAFALFSFIGCAVLGGLLTRWCGSLSVLLPTALTGTLTYRAWREDQRLVQPNAPGALVQRIAPAPAALPRLDVWPDSLPPRAPDSAPSVTGVKVAPLDAPKKDEPRNVTEGDRPPMKRTVSGTRLKTHYLCDDSDLQATAARARRSKT